MIRAIEIYETTGITKTEWDRRSVVKVWEGDKIFFDLLERDCGFFSLKLVYNIEDILKSAVLDGKPLPLTEAVL